MLTSASDELGVNGAAFCCDYVVWRRMLAVASVRSRLPCLPSALFSAYNCMERSPYLLPPRLGRSVLCDLKLSSPIINTLRTIVPGA